MIDEFLYRAWVLSPARLAVWSCAGPGMYVGDLARTLGISASTASYHLRILEEAGLVECHRHGKYRMYATTDARWAIISETELDDLDAGLPAPAATPIRPSALGRLKPVTPDGVPTERSLSRGPRLRCKYTPCAVHLEGVHSMSR